MFKTVPENICNVAQFTNFRETNGKSNSIFSFKRDFLGACSNLRSRQLTSHFGCVNAIEFSNGAQSYLASGGDDKRVLLWDLGAAFYKLNYKPVSMSEAHISNIFCLAFGAHNSRLFSSGNDEQILIHDVTTLDLLRAYHRDAAIYAISAHPTDPNVFATASDDGWLRIADMRVPSQADILCQASFINLPFHGVAFNPVEPMFVAGANTKSGACLWDVRQPKSVLLQYGCRHGDNAMSVRFNESGSRLVVVRRRDLPAVYEAHRAAPIVEFTSQSYLNSCTMKSGCFAGESDEYIVSGSDDFKIYLWKIPKYVDSERKASISPHIVLRGHRSVVNQVRYNKEMQLLASSGVEKIVQMWSPFQYKNFTGTIDDPSPEPGRSLYTRNEYVHLVLQSGMSLTHDYESENTSEDPRMMAFFDSLIEYDRRYSTSSTDEENAPNTNTASTALNGLVDSISTSSDRSESSDDSPSDVLRMWQRLAHNNQTSDSRTNARLRRLREMRSEITDSDSGQANDVGSNLDASKTVSSNVEKPSCSRKLDVNEDAGSSAQCEEEFAAKLRGSPEDSTKKDPDLPPEDPDSVSQRSQIKKGYFRKRKGNNATFLSEKRPLSSSDDSDPADSPHSKMRKRNAMRLRKIHKKWVVTPTSLPKSPPKDVPRCSGLSPETKCQSKEGTSLEEEFPDAYVRSRVKLHRSMELTDLRFAHIADDIASAIEEDERNNTNNENGDTNNESDELANPDKVNKNNDDT